MPKKQTFKQDDSFPATAEAGNLISKQASCLSSSTMQSTVVQNNENVISYCCDYCGKTTGRLSLCRGCCRVWYCSLACHKKAWKGGHANTCGNVGNAAPVFLWDAWKFQQESLERAVAVATTTTTTSMAGRDDDAMMFPHCRNPCIKEQYFKILGDSNVYFLPSDFDIVPTQFQSHALAFMKQAMPQTKNVQATELMPQAQRLLQTKRMVHMYHSVILMFILGLYYVLLDPIVVVWPQKNVDSCMEFISPNEHEVICTKDHW